jgi:hypothetical protein
MNCPVCQKDYSNKGLYTHMARAHGSEEERAKYAGGNHGKYHLSGRFLGSTIQTFTYQSRMFIWIRRTIILFKSILRKFG